jgi:SAM-dependent methyltransferase
MKASPNRAQGESWNGRTGEHWVAEAERYDRMMATFGAAIVEKSAAQPGETVLDVGCGNGALCLAICPLVLPGGTVTGLDLSGPMLEVAAGRAGAAGVTNLSLHQGDAQIHPLVSGAFDIVVSRFGVMFFDDPVAAFANLARALKVGGRLVIACWCDLIENEWLTVPVGAALEIVPLPDLEEGGPGPFSLADPDTIRRVLVDAGFAGVHLDEVRSSMLLGSSVDDTVTFMRSTEMADVLMKGVDVPTEASAWAAVRDVLRARAAADGRVELEGKAWLVTAVRPN